MSRVRRGYVEGTSSLHRGFIEGTSSPHPGLSRLLRNTALLLACVAYMQLHACNCLHAVACMQSNIIQCSVAWSMQRNANSVACRLDWESDVSAHIFSTLQNEAAKSPKNPPRTPTLKVMSKVLWSMGILATAYSWPPAAAWRQGGPGV